MSKLVVLSTIALISSIIIDNRAHLMHARDGNIYVASNGNDRNDGRTPSRPLKSISLALDAARSINGPASIFLNGTFEISSIIKIQASNSNLILRKQDGAKALIINSGGLDHAIFIDRAHNITIEGISIKGFLKDGILARNSPYTNILNNEIIDTRSSGWSQGAIHLSGNITGSRIINNIVTGADYSGIIVDTDSTANVTDLHITGNYVHNVCRRIYDCGGIYVNDRTRRSNNITISNNSIINFGTTSTGGRGIYLDDWLSNSTAANNFIMGPGTYAFQIHGGSNNNIINNTIIMEGINKFLLYNPGVNSGWAEMTKNSFINNKVVLKAYQHSFQLVNPRIPSNNAPIFHGMLILNCQSKNSFMEHCK